MFLRALVDRTVFKGEVLVVYMILRDGEKCQLGVGTSRD